MSMRATILLVLALALASQGDPLREAMALGRSQDDVLFASFNKGYDLSPTGMVTRAEIVTEFRRAVLIVREHAQHGDFAFTLTISGRRSSPLKDLVAFIVAGAAASAEHVRQGADLRPLRQHRAELAADRREDAEAGSGVCAGRRAGQHGGGGADRGLVPARRDRARGGAGARSSPTTGRRSSGRRGSISRDTDEFAIEDCIMAGPRVSFSRTPAATWCQHTTSPSRFCSR